jgi:Uma2 family endonuclease
MSPFPQENRYSYADLSAWDDTVRYELYDGQPVALASPTEVHQRIVMELSRQIANYLVGKRCQIYAAPFDVRLFEKAGDRPEDVDTVVQPDLMVVCDRSKVDARGIHGAPDWVIEVLSPSTAHSDKLQKFILYQQAGVREYWIVDPATRIVSVYLLEDGAYHAATTYGSEFSVPVSIWSDFSVDLRTVFLS